MEITVGQSCGKTTHIVPTSPPELVEKVRQFEDKVRERPQVDFITEHVFHAEMYARTVRIGPNVVFTSVLIKRATLLILNGTCDVLAGDEWVRMTGYNVLPAETHRKQIYVTRSDVELTMVFPTEAKTVEEAESEFTDEGDNLLSRKQESDILRPCLELQPQPRS